MKAMFTWPPATASPAVRAARSGLSGRRVQTVVIGLVLLISTAASTLALGLLVDSNAPFDHAFAAQHGSEVTATAQASAAQLAATAHLPGVTAAAGPFPETTITATVPFTPPPGQGPPGVFQQQLTLVGRASPGGPVDDLTLESGHWPTQPNQIVLNDIRGPGESIGTQLTVTGVPGSPHLTIVGFASSITQTAAAWVLPSEVGALRAPGTPDVSQMLYRFARAATGSQVNGDLASVRAALPPGSVLGAQSYLTVKLQDTSSIAPWVPFIVAFGVMGLLLSVLIVANVVSGAVVAGTRRIGVLKSIGFSPGQVVASYVIQVAVPAFLGCVLGVIGGNLLSVPLLNQTAQVYGVGALAVPVWVDVAVPLVMLALAGAAAVLLALRAGRMSAVQAIATGRAPRPKHGYAAHRVLGRGPWARLPRSVTIGLAGPFARPTRTAITLAAILFGGIAVTFGAGLGISLNRVYNDLSHSATEPVQVNIPGPPGQNGGGGQVTAAPGSGPGPAVPSLAVEEQTVTAALRAQPGTLRYVAESDDQIRVLGLSDRLSLIGFGGDASWTGYALIAGHWYSGARQADVNTGFLAQTGTKVGDSYTLTSGNHQITIHIAGEIFDPSGGNAEIIASQSTLAALDPGLSPDQYDVALTPGTNAQAYADALGAKLGRPYQVNANGSNSSQFFVIIGLVATLTLLLVAVAALGVLNTVVLQTRERVHDLGVFKAIGMTPRQTIAMVVCSVAGIGLVAGLIAIPAGIAVHNYVLPVMGHAAQTDVPPSVLNVYQPAGLVLLALSGLVIAVAGALGPAGWAARTRTASALRAE
ncbi:MAG: FtsX-like permease family protein [Streptosporangiaceae bacterium]